MRLIPYRSTHFIASSSGGYSGVDFTPSKIYEIHEWKEEYFYFFDDKGDERSWTENHVEVQDASFKTNLEKILQ